MSFKKQVIIKNQAETVKEIFSRNAFQLAEINQLEVQVDKFEIRLPFIGNFSSGKSTLINALIDTDLFSTEVTPETAHPYEIRYGATQKFYGKLKNQEEVLLTEEAIRSNQLDSRLVTGSLICAELPNPFLEKLKYLVLVDMPGWSSGVEAHTQVIDQYVDRSLAYVVVVSADDGTLVESLRNALTELKLNDMPVILVISKAHKREESDLKSIKEQVSKEVQNILGKPPLAVACTSGAYKEVEELNKALEALDKQAEQVFNNTIVIDWVNELQRIESLLKISAETVFEDAALIGAEIELFKQKMQEVEPKLVRETANLMESVAPIISRVCTRVEGALFRQVDILANRLIAGGNVNDEILSTIRHETMQTLKEEFQPIVQKYLNNVADTLPSKLDFNFNLTALEKLGDKIESDFNWKQLGGALSPVLLLFKATPVTAVITTVISLISLFAGGGGKNKEQDQERREQQQLESAKSQIMGAINSVTEKIKGQLEPLLNEQIQQAKEMIEQKIATERTDIEQALNARQKALQQGEEAAEKQRNAAQDDISKLVNLMTDLK